MNFKTVLAKEFVSVFGFIILCLFVNNNAKVDTQTKKRFNSVILIGIAELIVFELELWTATFSQPTFWRILLSVIGYTLRPLLICQIILIADSAFFSKIKKFVLYIPAILCFLCVCTAFFAPEISFWYTDANVFKRGYLGYFPHAISIVYFATFLFIICRQAIKYSIPDIIIAISISVFAICSLIIDTFVTEAREIGVARIAIMLCSFFDYVQIQNKTLFSLIDNIPGAIAKFVIKNGKYQLVTFNDVLCETFGMSHDEFRKLTKKNAFLLLQDEYREEAERTMQSMTSQDYAVFHFSLNSDGVDKWYRVVLKVASRTKNEIVVYAIVSDVTKEKFAMEDLRVRNDEISLLMRQVGKSVCIYDVPTKKLQVTEEYAKQRGFSGTSITVPNDACEQHLISEEFVEQYKNFYNRIRAGEPSGNVIIKFINQDGTERWEKTDFVTVLDENKKPKRAIISIEDVTATYEEKLLLENYQSTLDNLMGKDKYCVRYDVTARKIVAYEGELLPIADEFKNKTLEELAEYLIANYAQKSDAEMIRNFMNTDNIISCYESGVNNSYIERLAVLPDGTEKWIKVSINIDGENGKNMIATLLWEDIDSEYRKQHELLTRANYDTLTMLLTRDATMQAIEEYLADDGKNGTHALIMMDMDNLKGVNDVLGHQFGDTALKDFSQEVKRFFEQDDIIGRIGGDEFFVFVKNITSSALSIKMNTLIQNLEKVYESDSEQVKTTASAGIAMYYGDKLPTKTLTELYSDADVALYKSKALGKNTFSFADEVNSTI